jgi:fumarate reductase subunit D
MDVGGGCLMARSHKPIVWGLFAAGGTVAAFILPVILILSGPAIVFGLLPADYLAYDHIRGLLEHPLSRLMAFGVLSLIVWHAAHRLRITMHDFGIRADTFVAVFFYCIAAVSTIVLMIALIRL